MSNRDNFTKRTVDILGKRVGYLCSNPNCRAHTIGPNENPSKATLIGVASHISAASAQGPRYNSEFSEIERKHIDNGIWLCSNCAALIDKDELRFSILLPKNWKRSAEDEMLGRLISNTNVISKPIPFLEADLIWNHSSRRNTGYSPKNPIIIEDGRQVMLIDQRNGPPIIFWEIKWRFTFIIHNNSRVPAYNVAIENKGEKKFSRFTTLSKVNNLPPFKSVDLEAEYFQLVEGPHTVADEMMSKRIPAELDGLTLKLTYLDDERISHSTIVKVEKDDITNHKE